MNREFVEEPPGISASGPLVTALDPPQTGSLQWHSHDLLTNQNQRPVSFGRRGEERRRT
jgi:hypothetical protein